MKITLLTYGTRGDVQPYAVLGDHLARRGHDVSITACTNLVEMTGGRGCARSRSRSISLG